VFAAFLVVVIIALGDRSPAGISRAEPWQLVLLASNGGQVMLRKMMITLAAAAALTAGSMIPASAHGMGGGHGGGGGGHGGGGGMMYGHGGGFAHSGGFVGGRPFAVHGGFHNGFHDGRFAFRHHNRFFFNTFAFSGGYPYDDGCFQRIWTRWGWRVVSVCY
jgi:hypothetical protein